MRKPARTLKEWSKTILARCKTVPNGCMNYPRTNKGGYGRICLSTNGRNNTVLAHRVVYQIEFNMDIKDWMVLHKCDNPACCNPKHLFHGTNQDNQDDMVSKGRSNKLFGEDHPQTVIPDKTIQAIRKHPGRNYIIAKEFGLDPLYVWGIRKGVRRKILTNI